MRILITGAQGQLGRCLTQILKGKVTLLAVGRAELNISDKDSVYNTFNEFRPDYVINAAAYTGVEQAEDNFDEACLVNKTGAKILSEVANSFKATILHISTDYVFDGEKEGNYIESDSPNPLSVYGMTKSNGEQCVIAANNRHIIIRTSWVFSQHCGNFVNTILNLAHKNKELNIISDQYGGPTYAGDIAKAIITIVEKIEANPGFQDYGIYHYSGFPYASWFEFANVIVNKSFSLGLIENKPNIHPISSKCYPTKANRPKNSKLSTEKINKIFDISHCNWELGLNCTLQKIRDQNDERD